jgi:hypothetical protein
MKTRPQRARFRDAAEADLKKGKINANSQRCRGTLNVPGTAQQSIAYKLECLLCGLTYGSNSGEVAGRKCPNCQGGEEGIRYWLIARKVLNDPAAANGSAEDVHVEYDTEENAGDWLMRTWGGMKDVPEAEYQEFLECCRKSRDEINRLAYDAGL